MSEDVVHGVTPIDRYISDHAIIMCWLSLCKPGLSVNTITYRKLTSIELNSFKSDLKNFVRCKSQFQDTGDKNIADLDAIVREVMILFYQRYWNVMHPLTPKLKLFDRCGTMMK